MQLANVLNVYFTRNNLVSNPLPPQRAMEMTLYDDKINL